MAAIVLASVGMSLSTFVGAATAAAAPWLLVPIVAAWAYFTGLAVCLGATASIAIFQWAIALLISMALPADPAEAALRAGFVLAGGLLHAVFVAASWTYAVTGTNANLWVNPPASGFGASTPPAA